MTLNLTNDGSMIVSEGNMEKIDNPYRVGLPENSDLQVCPVCDGQGILWTAKNSKLNPITSATATLIMDGKLWVPYVFQKYGQTMQCPRCNGMGRINRAHKFGKF